VAPVALLLAAVVAPVVLVPLLALAAHLLLGGTLPVRRRVPLGAAAAVLAVVVAAVLVGGPGAPGVPVLALVVGAGLVVAAFVLLRWVRPVVTPAAVLLVLAAVPGPVAPVAAALAVPAVAVVAGLLAARATESGSHVVVRLGLVATGVSALLLGTSSAVLATSPAPASQVPADERAAAPEPAPEPVAAPVTGADIASLAEPEVPTVQETDPDLRVRQGSALADNPALDLSPVAAGLLRDGAVDDRVTAVLAALAGARSPEKPLVVLDFPVAAADGAADVRHTVLLGAGADLEVFLAAQQGGYAPLTVQPAGPALFVTWTER
jgi:hypothetical protein